MSTYCDRCGEPVGDSGPDRHPSCQAARELEPPRFCPQCRRRMKVQVLPAGWRASCVEHGTITPGTLPGTSGAPATVGR